MSGHFSRQLAFLPEGPAGFIDFLRQRHPEQEPTRFEHIDVVVLDCCEMLSKDVCNHAQKFRVPDQWEDVQETEAWLGPFLINDGGISYLLSPFVLLLLHKDLVYIRFMNIFNINHSNSVVRWRANLLELPTLRRACMESSHHETVRHSLMKVDCLHRNLNPRSYHESWLRKGRFMKLLV